LLQREWGRNQNPEFRSQKARGQNPDVRIQKSEWESEVHERSDHASRRAGQAILDSGF
jgi:hypothetical protein